MNSFVRPVHIQHEFHFTEFRVLNIPKRNLCYWTRKARIRNNKEVRNHTRDARQSSAGGFPADFTRLFLKFLGCNHNHTKIFLRLR